MNAIVINEYGGPEKLEWREFPDPHPGPDEILVRVKAASVNPVDWKIREGRLKFITGRTFPLFLGTEVAGFVEEVGSEVKGFKPGDRVFAGMSYKGGGYAEKAVTRGDRAILIPPEIGFTEACTFAVAGITPLQGFRKHTGVKKGTRVLVNGASGGVGTYAVQIAKLLGGTVTGVCSEKNMELVKGLGADEVIDYRKEDFRDRHETWDIILDAASNAVFKEVRSSLRKNGVLIKLNYSVRTILTGAWTRLFSDKKVKMIVLHNEPADLEWIRDHVASGAMRVVVDRTFPLEDAAEAHRYSETLRAVGKIVLVVE